MPRLEGVAEGLDGALSRARRHPRRQVGRVVGEDDVGPHPGQEEENSGWAAIQPTASIWVRKVACLIEHKYA